MVVTHSDHKADIETAEDREMLVRMDHRLTELCIAVTEKGESIAEPRVEAVRENPDCFPT